MAPGQEHTPKLEVGHADFYERLCERFALHRAQGIRYGEMEQQAARAAHVRLGVALPWSE